KCAVPSTSQYNRTSILVHVHRIDGLEKRLQLLSVKRVECLPTVERQDADSTTSLDIDSQSGSPSLSRGVTPPSRSLRGPALHRSKSPRDRNHRHDGEAHGSA